MSLLTVVKDVCLAVGVNPLTTMFGTSIQPRTQAEMLSLANEVTQRIAYDVREWRALKSIAVFEGSDADRHALPNNFKRMLLSSNVYSSAAPLQPLRFIPDTDEWLVRRLNNQSHAWGEWTLIGNDMLIHPNLRGYIPAVPPDPNTGEPGHAAVPAQRASFVYLDKNSIELRGPNGELNGYGDRFVSDSDTWRLDERLLKLAMIWQWKANKGSPYAEDMGTYSDALVMVAGADSPAPIIMDQGGRVRLDVNQLQ